MDINMSKIKLKIVENTFWHCEYSNNPMPPVSFSKYVEWDRDVSEEEDLVFYTDRDIQNTKPRHKRNITPITNEVIPVLPPAFTPAPDST